MDDALESHLLSQTDDATRFFWHRVRWRFVAMHLPARPFTLLDVGAGSGVTGSFLTRSRPDATYAFDEPIDSLRALLRARYGEQADLHGAERLPHVDVVTLLDVLEHIDRDRDFLTELVDRLEPATTIIVTVPASQRLWSQWDVALGHVRRYDLDTLTNLLGAVPVDLVETGHLFPEMVPAAWWRARSRPDTQHAACDAEFPGLPRPVDLMLELLGRPGVRWRTSIPFGTSLCAVVRVRA